MTEITLVESKIDKRHIYYKCPTCVSRYNKDGKPSKNSKPVYHKHGSSGELHNRVEHRSHHKVYNFPKNQETYSTICIIINDETKRV